MTPAVTVLLTTYNRAHLLKRAVESVVQQTFRDFELIILDDGSSDETSDYAFRLSQNHDAIRYVRRPHTGLPAVMLNLGLAQATGEYVTWLCDDDAWKPEMLEFQVECLKRNPEVVGVYTKAEGVPEVECWEGWIYPRLLEHNFIPGTVMWRRVAGISFNERADLRGYEDWLAWLDLAELGPILKIDEPLRLQSVTPGSISRSTPLPKHFSAVAEVYRLHVRPREEAQARSDAFWARFPAPYRYPFAFISRCIAGFRYGLL